jgi:hypothetical protein
LKQIEAEIHRGLMGRMGAFGLMALAMGFRPGPDPLAGIDIEKEYELIQRKQSNLPRSRRDMVVYRVERQSGA